MKRKITISAIVVAALAAYVAGAWWLATALGAQGRMVWILRIGLAFLGVLVAVFALIYLLRKPAPPPPPKDAVAEELQRALVAAEKKLALAKVAPSGALGKLPVVLMLGAPGSAKTSSVVRSGLDVELLTGDVFREDAVVTTRGANLWFGRNTLFLEPGRDITDDATRWRWLLHRLQPARLRGALSSGQQAPRVAVVCYSCEGLTAAGATDAATTAARALRDRLGQLAQAFGIRLPIYVVFSKADRVPGFAEYVQHFTKDEARVVLGATLPLSSRADGASHAERETRRLNDAWSRLFAGLAARRIEVLARETAGDRKPAAYEFPRELRKLATPAVQFLVELCRPTELGLGPVLRGFYLTGVRAVVTSDAAAVPSLMPAREAQAAVAATSVFRPVASPAAASSAPVVSGGRKKPEWVFLSSLFPDVVLADSVAIGVTRGGARISGLRRTLAGVGIGVAAALIVAFTFSFFGNRALQRSVQHAVAGAATLPAQTVATPTLPQLAALDSLRDRVAWLSDHEGDAPFWLSWGLYAGDRLYQPARAAYFRHFEHLLYDSTRAGLNRAMRTLAAPNAAVPYDTAYSLLRTYLVTTDEFARSTREMVGPVLTTVWPQSAAVDSTTRDVARRQFEFFGSELRKGNPYDKDRRDGQLVADARNLLKKSSGIRSIYMSVITAAARHGQAVRLGNSGGGAVINNAEVAPQFTKTAWTFLVDTALGKDLDSYLQGEPWVTGGIATPPANRDSLARELKRMYIQDYVQAWRQYVKSASIAGFADLRDAAKKVDVLAKPTSPLLGMLLTVSEHTIVDSVFVRVPLQPVDVVMPLKNKETFVGGANQDYMDQLGKLSNALQQVGTVPPGGDPTAQLQAALGAVGDVRTAVGKLARQFASEPERELRMEDLLKSPANRVETLITIEQAGAKRAGDVKAINEAAAAFCSQVRDVLDKFPFSRSQTAATGAELTKLFKPGGDIGQFYDQSLKTVLARSGTGFRDIGGGARATPELVRFMTSASRITNGLFPNGATEPRMQVTIRPQLTQTMPTLTLAFGDQPFQFARGGETTVTPTWRFKDGQPVVFSRSGSGRTVEIPGPWAPLRIWDEARGDAAGAKTYDVILGPARATVDISFASGVGEPSFFSMPSCPVQAVR